MALVIPKKTVEKMPKQAQKSHCIRGHDLNEVGVVIQTKVRGPKTYYTRRCKRCLIDDVLRMQRKKHPTNRKNTRVLSEPVRPR